MDVVEDGVDGADGLGGAKGPTSATLLLVPQGGAVCFEHAAVVEFLVLKDEKDVGEEQIL